MLDLDGGVPVSSDPHDLVELVGVLPPPLRVGYSETRADLEGGVIRNIVQFARKPLLQRGIPMVRKFASGANCW